MALQIFLAIVVFLWAFFNVYAALCYSSQSMYDELIRDREVICIVCANIFFAPAWILKLFRHTIDALIR